MADSASSFIVIEGLRFVGRSAKHILLVVLLRDSRIHPAARAPERGTAPVGRFVTGEDTKFKAPLAITQIQYLRRGSLQTQVRREDCIHMGLSFASFCSGLKMAGPEIIAATLTRLISLPIYSALL